MATIRASIQIFDGMTPALRSMTNAMNIVINSFETMQRQSGNAIDTRSIATARNELARTETYFNQIEESINRARNGQNGLNNSIRNGTSHANGLLGKLGAIAATYIGLQGLGGILKTSDELTLTTAKLGMIADEQHTVAQLQDEIFQSAQRSRGVYADTARFITKIGMNAGKAFEGNDELIAFAEQLNKSFIIAGATQSEIDSALLQLSQGLASGRLQGDELRSVFEAAPNILQKVADYLDVDIGKIRDMASEGMLTPDIIKNAMLGAAKETNEAFEKIPVTFAQAWTMFKNDALMAFQPFLSQLNGIVNSDTFEKFKNNAVGVLKNVSKVASDVLTKIVDVFSQPEMLEAINGLVNGFGALVVIFLNVLTVAAQFQGLMAENWSILGPIIWGVIGALAAYKMMQMGVRAVEMVSIGVKTALAFASGLKAAATGGEAIATSVATAAQYGLNTALYACPLTWIILAIVLLIGVIYIAVAAINHFAGTSVSATGIVMGIFFVLGAFIYNQIAWLWNIFASFAEFFANVLIDPVGAIKGLIGNLVISALKMAQSLTKGWDETATNFANAMIDAVNTVLSAWNWLVEKLGKIGQKLGLNKATKFEHTTSITSTIGGMIGDVEGWMAEGRSDKYWTAPKMDTIGYGDAWNNGYNLGQGIDSAIGDIFNPDKMDDLFNGDNHVQDAIDKALGGGNGDALTDAANGAKDTADNTAKLNKTMDASSEDLKYLRDIAEREAINRFTTAEIKVEMNNNNNINSNMDLDGVVDHLKVKLEEQMAISAEGV